MKKECSQEDQAVYPKIESVTKAFNNSISKQKNSGHKKYYFEPRCEIDLSQEELSVTTTHNVIKNTPQETKLIKSPLSYLDKRHKDIQIDFNPKLESKPPVLESSSHKFDKS